MRRVGRILGRRAGGAVAPIGMKRRLSFAVGHCSFGGLRARRIGKSMAWESSGLAHSRSFASPSGPSVNEDGTVNFVLADIGEGIAECEVMQWFVQPGDKIAQFDKVCEVQSDKATVEITSRYDGVIKSLAYGVGDMAVVGKPLVTIQVEGGTEVEAAQPDQPEVAAPAAAPAAKGFKPSLGGGKSLASPAVRRLAAEHSLDLAAITGTGPSGIVTKGDVLAFIAGDTQPSFPSPTPSSPSPPPSAAKPVPVATPLQEDKVVKIAGLQRIMVNTMVKANSVPSFVYSDEIEVDSLQAMRALLKPLAEARGVRLSNLPFIIKATSLALTQYPMLNAHVNEDCTEVVHRSSHNIGIAVDTPRGLLVPSIKNVQDLSVLEIAQEVNRLVELGQASKLGTAELTGGTFTLSNIGVIGGTYCVPLLVCPEVMIGALGKFQTVPRFNDKQEVVPVTIMNVGWTADHRVLDGATVARFSNVWKGYVENPASMLAELK